MKHSVVPAGSRVRVTSYGPFRELQGTIKEVISIVDDWEDPVCFYLKALEGATMPMPIWFECHEVELIGFPAETLKPPNELTRDISLRLEHKENRCQ
jgi:hypothetical protein